MPCARPYHTSTVKTSQASRNNKILTIFLEKLLRKLAHTASESQIWLQRAKKTTLTCRNRPNIWATNIAWRLRFDNSRHSWLRSCKGRDFLSLLIRPRNSQENNWKRPIRAADNCTRVHERFETTIMRSHWREWLVHLPKVLAFRGLWFCYRLNLDALVSESLANDAARTKYDYRWVRAKAKTQHKHSYKRPNPRAQLLVS